MTAEIKKIFHNISQEMSYSVNSLPSSYCLSSVDSYSAFQLQQHYKQRRIKLQSKNNSF